MAVSLLVWWVNNKRGRLKEGIGLIVATVEYEVGKLG